MQFICLCLGNISRLFRVNNLFDHKVFREAGGVRYLLLQSAELGSVLNHEVNVALWATVAN